MTRLKSHRKPPGISGGFFRDELIRNKRNANGLVMRPTASGRTIAHNRAKVLRLVSTLIEACASMSMIGEEAQAL
jgi:hypothetical protein